MKKSSIVFLNTAFIFLSFSSSIQGQSKPAPLTETEKKQVVDSVCKILNDYYVYPDVAKKTADYISTNFTNGIYKKVNDPTELASRLTQDVRSINHDKHFHVFFDPDKVADERKAITTKDSTVLIQKEIESGIEFNFGFQEVKILDGNIGYINFVGFEDLQYSAETINGAMSLLANTKAMIIDLRYNHGGYQNTLDYIASFFFSQEPAHLFDDYIREGGKTKEVQHWTFPYINGKRRPHIPLYFLTSNFSFSGAEALPFAFQGLKRAVVVGETTGGGAHAWIGKIATDRFYVHVPNAYSSDPKTKKDWEGVGVKPDIEVPAKDALLRAHIEALEKLAKSDTAKTTLYNWHLETAKSKLEPSIVLDHATLHSYTGEYGSRRVTLENGKLYLHSNGSKLEMLPMSKTLFRIEEVNILRVNMVLEKGIVTAMERRLAFGDSYLVPKAK